MFYKLIFTLFIFSSFCFSSNDIQNLKSFQSKFTQTITSSSSDIITYQGEVFIKSSGQILWKYKTPVVKNVYIEKIELNGKAVKDFTIKHQDIMNGGKLTFYMTNKQKK